MDVTPGRSWTTSSTTGFLAGRGEDGRLRVLIGHVRSRRVGVRRLVDVAPTFGDSERGRDVRLLVVREPAFVGRFVGAVRKRDAAVNLHAARQPHARERLSHRHRRANVVHLDEPRAWQEVHPDVVEGVLDDLMFSRIDPQRDHRRLVHLAADPVLVLLSLVLLPLLGWIVVVEHALRVVLDAQDLLSLETLTPGEVVVARLELELHEVRLGYEPRRGNR